MVATIAAGNDYKERLPQAPYAVLSTFATWAHAIGPLGMVDDTGRVVCDMRTTRIFALVVFAASHRWREDAISGLVAAAHTDVAKAHEDFRARVARSLSNRPGRPLEDGTVPDDASMKALVGRVATVLDYMAAVAHGERQFEPDRWLRHGGWAKRRPEEPATADNVAYVWGAYGGELLLGPRLDEPAAPKTNRKGLKRVCRSDYSALRALAARPAPATDQELERCVLAFKHPLPLDQARRFYDSTRKTARRSVNDGRHQAASTSGSAGAPKDPVSGSPSL